LVPDGLGLAVRSDSKKIIEGEFKNGEPHRTFRTFNKKFGYDSQDINIHTEDDKIYSIVLKYSMSNAS